MELYVLNSLYRGDIIKPPPPPLFSFPGTGIGNESEVIVVGVEAGLVDFCVHINCAIVTCACCCWSDGEIKSSDNRDL